MTTVFRTLSAQFVLASALFTVGCGAGFVPGPVESPLGTIQGNIHGGQAPIAGSHVYLLAAATGGYAGPGLTAASTNASLSLLTSTGNSDSVGSYVLTDSNGSFSITGDYNCTAGTQVYVYASGGNAGGGENSHIGLLAALGTCPATGSFAATVPYIWVNEVSTVAAAYAMSGFATDATHVGIGPIGSAVAASSLASTGLANAFASSANLASLATGVAATATTGNNGTVPQAEIDSLANILASCVNASDTGFANCTTLFGAAQSGGTTGSTPTETATAAINIAHNPAANVGALFGLQAGVAAPFQPDLPSAPNDFTIHIVYTGGGLTKPKYGSPRSLAVDGAGNIWNADYVASGGNVSEFTTLGVPLSGSTGFTGGGLNGPLSLSIDSSIPANILLTNFGNSTLSEFTSAGTAVTGSPFTPTTALSSPSDAEFDGSGNIWVNNIGGFLTKVTSSFAFVSKSATTGLSTPYGIAIAAGATGGVWAANNSTSATGLDATQYTNANTFAFDSVLSYRTYGGVAVDATGNAWYAEYNKYLARVPAVGGTATEYQMGATQFKLPALESSAIDGAGNAWATDYGNGTIYEVSNSGSNLSGTYGFIIPGNTNYGASNETLLTTPNSIAVDGSGNVWYSTLSDATLHELVGASVPVVTPTSYAVKNSFLGSRP